jgi:ketosteroid isomerase-like protein
MTTTRLITLTVILLVFPLLLSAQTKQMEIQLLKPVRVFNPDFRGKPEGQIESLEHKLSDAWVAGDAPTLNDLHADDVLIKDVIGDKTQYIALLTGPAMKNKFISIEKSEMRIRIHGDIAVVTGREDTQMKTPDGASTSTSPFMDVWKKMKDGKWRCIAVA